MRKALIVLAGVLLITGCGNSKNNDEMKVSAALENNFSQKGAAVSNPDTLINAGLGYLKDGDLKSAIRSFDEAIRKNPKDVKGYLILGETYMHLKEYSRAIDTFNVAVQVAPDNGQAHYLLAANLGLAGNIPMARLQAQKCIQIFGKNKDEENFKRSIALLQGLQQIQPQQ